MNKKTKIIIRRLLYLILNLGLIFSTIYLIYAILLYNNIETGIRILGCITLCVMAALFMLLLKKFYRVKNRKIYIILFILFTLYVGGISFAAYKISSIYNKISNISKEEKMMFSTSIITRKDAHASKYNQIPTNSKIAIIADENDYEGYTLAYRIINNKKIKTTRLKEYDSYEKIFDDLLDGKIDYAFVPTNYADRYSSDENYGRIGVETKIVYSEKFAEEEEKNEIKETEVKSLNEPFTVLIMGVDTTNDGFKSGFNSDALLLVTFNPKTTNATILSIPRDTYMPISCMGNRSTKITNAGWQGEKCVKNSIQNFFGIKIDYTVKINFNGVVSLVNAVGGVEVNVPYSFCEQNSKRQWGKNTIFVKAGKQTLNGEQALAYARHRKVTSYMVKYCGPSYTTHATYWNDFVRGQHQQEVINALLKKFKDIKSFEDFEKILDTISKNMKTDISTDNIFSLYNLGKNMLKRSSSQENVFQMQKLYIQGFDTRIYDYNFRTKSGSKLELYNYFIYDESKNAVIKAMKENLGLQQVEPVKKFTFSIQKKYTEHVIGKGVTGGSSLELMPNFVGKNVSVAENYASKNGITLTVTKVTATGNQSDGQIISQSIPKNTDLSQLSSAKSMEIKVAEKVEVPEEENEPETNPEEQTPSTETTTE